MAHHHKLAYLVKRLHCCVELKVKVIAKAQHFNEFSSGLYLLNYLNFCIQIWYGNTSAGPECHAKRLVAIFKVKVTVKAHLIKYNCFCHIYRTTTLFAAKFNWMVHHYILECLV